MVVSNEERYEKSLALGARGEKFIAGGVVSLNRKVEPRIAFAQGLGSRLWDVDGNEYIDYHAAFSPHLLGHNDKVVNDAAREAIAKEWSLMGSGTTEWEVELAELLCEVVVSLDLVQITNTGSEATAHAIRLSRAFTERDDIIVTLGGYNGWHNDVGRAVMPGAGAIRDRVSPGEYPFLSLSAGIPDSTKRLVHIVNFNDLESVEYVMRRYPVACVMTEPVLQNVGVVKPREGYLAGLRKLCDEYGSVLVFDEVKTGFRSALGGYQSVAGVGPDLSVFGKAVANGYPMGVIGGKREIMELFADADPAKRVLIAGTYNAHPFTSAAAIATIRRLMADEGAVYDYMDKVTGQLCDGLAELFGGKGIEHVVARNGSAFCVYFMDHEPTDWHDILAHHDFDFDVKYRCALIERGIYHFPLPCKQGSVSAAHSEDDVAKTLEITADVLAGL